MDRRERVGYEFVHSLLDDHSRFAYTELHKDERAATVVGFVERALAVFEAHGIEPQRLQTDNAWAYTKNRALAELLAARGIEHRRTRPVHQAQRQGRALPADLKREWGLGQRYRSSAHRARALPHWLRHYNERRRHSAIGNARRSAAFGTS